MVCDSQAGDAPRIEECGRGMVWRAGVERSWRITVEQDQLDAVRVTGGFNPFDFGYVLKPGEKLETPVFYGGYSRTWTGRRFAAAAPL